MTRLGLFAGLFITMFVLLTTSCSGSGGTSAGADAAVDTPPLRGDVAPDVGLDAQQDQADGIPDMVADVPQTDVIATLKMVVTPEGATLDLLGGNTLEIPAGAVAEDITITVESLTAPVSQLFAPVGAFYRFSPAGTHFDEEVILTITVDPDQVNSLGLTMVWREEGQEWTAVPTAILDNEDAAVLVARVSHFSEGGAGNWLDAKGACCNPMACDFVSSDDCPAGFVGPGVPCDLDGGNTCDSLLCCKPAMGADTEMMTIDDCDALSGSDVDPDNCVPICCQLPDGTMSVKTLGTCKSDIVGGTSIGPAEVCTPVCCRHGEDFYEIEESSAACTESGGTLVEDNGACDEVCCVSGEVGFYVPAGFCEDSGGAVKPLSDCEGMVCCVSESEAVLMSDSTSCFVSAGLVMPTESCKEKCCNVKASYTAWAGANCDTLGEEAPLWLCEKVCCLVDGTYFIEERGNCETHGDVVGGTQVCDGKVCCGVDDSYFQLVESEAYCEDTVGGTPVTGDKCEHVCCNVDGEFIPDMSQELCDQLGSFWLDGACEEVCCQGETGATLMAKEKCELQGETVAATSVCDVQVCCLQEGFEPEFVESEAACTDGGGGVAGSSMCIPVCCEVGGIFYDGVPAEECDQTGEVVDYAQCAQVCCSNDAGTAVLSSVGACTGPGLNIAPSEDCDQMVCCLVDGDAVLVSEESLCTDEGGSAASMESCKMNCCKLESDYVAWLGTGCDLAGGQTAPIWKCDEVCCLVDGQHVVRTRGFCEDSGEIAGSKEDCTAMVCCGKEGTYSLVESVQQCEDVVGGVSFDNSYCELTCCRTGDGTFVSDTPVSLCNNLGTPWPQSACAEVCCDNWALGQTLVPNQECTEWGDTVLEMSLCKSQICCIFDGFAPILMETYEECTAEGGAVLPMDDCQGVCCEVDGVFYANTPLAECVQTGLVALDGSCIPVCCGVGLTWMYITAGECANAMEWDVLPMEDCAGKVCCGEQGLAVLLDSENDCPGGPSALLSPDHCASSCCKIGDVYSENVGDECTGVGDKVSAIECAPVCCMFDDETVFVAHGYCQEHGGMPTPVVNCNSMLCCVSPEGRFLVESAEDCIASAGEAAPADACYTTCCLVDDKLVSDVPVHDCEQIGEPQLAANCAQICCDVGEEGDPVLSFVPMGQCPAGKAAPKEACDTQVCCIGLESYQLMHTEQQCLDSGAEIVELAEECAPVCCLISDQYLADTPHMMCDLSGQEVDAGSCAPVCCAVNSGGGVPEYLHITAGACAILAGTATPLDTCDDMICCQSIIGYVLVEDEEACGEDEGEVASLEDCTPTCCLGEVYYNSNESLLPGGCEGQGTQGVPDFYCVDTCCAAFGTFITTAMGNCLALGQPAGSTEPCETNFCCVTETSSMIVTNEADCTGPGAEIVGLEYCGKACCADGNGNYLADSVLGDCLEGVNLVLVDQDLCTRVCCTSDGESKFRTTGWCEDNGGVVEEDQSLFAVFCCELADEYKIMGSQACFAAGGAIASGSYCPKDSCMVPPGTVVVDTSTMSGSLSEYTDSVTAHAPGCDDLNYTDTNKLRGPDMFQGMQVPAGSCAMARGDIVGANPGIYIIDDCPGNEPSCLAYTYGQDAFAWAIPQLYPPPSPGERRTTAVQYCNDTEASMSVYVWLDSSDYGSGAAKGPYDPGGAGGDFAFSLATVTPGSINDSLATAKDLGSDGLAPLEGLVFATDQFAASGCPGLADGAGAATPDLFYTVSPTEPDTMVLRMDLLNLTDFDIDAPDHFLAVMEEGGPCIAALAGGVAMQQKLQVDAGKTYVLIFDGGTLPEGTMFDAGLAPYSGPANDTCDAEEGIDTLAFSIEGTTNGAFDDFATAGVNCDAIFNHQYGAGGADVVFSYSPDADGLVDIILSTETAGYHPSLIVSQDCPDGPDVECVNGAKVTNEGPALITMAVEAGQTYHLAVDGGNEWDTMLSGDFLLQGQESSAAPPDDCDSAQQISSLPYAYIINGGNLTDVFQGHQDASSSPCSGYFCCQVGEIYQITDSCEGIVSDDWSNCETVCCQVGTSFSEELAGNCQHYGGIIGCPSSSLPVSCCQILVLPQISYVMAAGCGQPTAGGVQGTPMDSSYCDQVCCVGHGVQKRGACDDFEAESLPFPPSQSSCDDPDSVVGTGMSDAVFSYTADEPGMIKVEASSSGDSSLNLNVYGMAGSCVEGLDLFCASMNPYAAQMYLSLDAGETGYAVVDGWDPEHPFDDVQVSFSWIPGALSGNDDCDSAMEIAALPFQDDANLLLAHNDLAGVDSPSCSGISSVSNGKDLVYHLDPALVGSNVTIGITNAETDPLLYVLDHCPAQLPFEYECKASATPDGDRMPQIHFEDLDTDVLIVAGNQAGSADGPFELHVIGTDPPPNDTCETAVDITELPTTVFGYTQGASNDYVAPMGVCSHTNYSDYGAGPDVAYRLEVTQEIVDTYSQIWVVPKGLTFYPHIWVMKGSCDPEGETCISANFNQMLLMGNWYNVGDVLYFIVDGSQEDSAGMFSITFEGN